MNLKIEPPLRIIKKINAESELFIEYPLIYTSQTTKPQPSDYKLDFTLYSPLEIWINTDERDFVIFRHEEKLFRRYPGA